jgi:predicted DNA-binding transcriptional regulator YafY
MERLEQLTDRLRVDEPMVLRDVAEELGVSMSTINRDVGLLRERGVPIETDRGRGGGIRVSKAWGVGRISLTFQEAVDLLVSIATIEKMELPMMFGSGRLVRTKLISSFSKPDQAKVKKLASRIRVGPTSSPQVISTYRPEASKITRDIHKSFLLMQRVEISYIGADGAKTTRIIEPQYMVLNHPVWYILGWDLLRNDVRTFRCDRLSKVTVQDSIFNLRPWGDFQQAMEGNALITP